MEKIFVYKNAIITIIKLDKDETRIRNATTKFLKSVMKEEMERSPNGNRITSGDI